MFVFLGRSCGVDPLLTCPPPLFADAPAPLSPAGVGLLSSFQPGDGRPPLGPSPWLQACLQPEEVAEVREEVFQQDLLGEKHHLQKYLEKRNEMTVFTLHFSPSYFCDQPS